MKLSTLLLSSAALVVAGSAYAADLPAKKGAPAALAGCPAFGAGFFQIPGSDTCLKIGGYARYNGTVTLSSVARGTAPYSNAGIFDIGFDARSNSEVGVVRAYGSLYDGATEYSYVSVGGLTAGVFASPWDIGNGGINSGFVGPTDTGLMYTTAVGSSSVSVSAITAKTSSGTNVTTSDRPDLMVAFSTSAGAAKVNLAAVSHAVVGTASGTGQGYAVLGTASMAAGAATLNLYGAYGQGASYYLSNGNASLQEADTASANLSSGTALGAAVGISGFQVFGSSFNIQGTGGATTNKDNRVGVNYTYNVAKNLYVKPEVYNKSLDTGSGATQSQTLYLRIHRDF